MLLVLILVSLPVAQAADPVDCYSCRETNSHTAPAGYSEVLEGMGAAETCSKDMLATPCSADECLSAVYMLELDDSESPVSHTMRVYACGTPRRQKNLCKNMNTTVASAEGVTLTRCTIVLCPDTGCNVPKAMFAKAATAKPTTAVPTVTKPTDVDPALVDPVDEATLTDEEETSAPLDDGGNSASVDEEMPNNTVNGTVEERNVTMIEEGTSETNITNITEEDEVDPVDETINETIAKVVEDIDEVVGNATRVEEEESKGEKEEMAEDNEEEKEETVESSSSLLIPGTLFVLLLFWCL